MKVNYNTILGNMEVKQDNKKNTRPKKYNFIKIIIIILIVIAVIFGLYSRYGSLFRDNPSNIDVVNTNQPVYNNIKDQMLSYIDELKTWQSSIDNKITSLYNNQDAIISKENNLKIDSKNNLNNINPNIGIKDKNFLKNFKIVLSFINVITTDQPFVAQLAAFKNISLSSNYEELLNQVNSLAEQGVPTSKQLSSKLQNLQIYIIRDSYRQDKSWFGKFKYYLSYFFIVKKYKHFSDKDTSNINYIINQINSMLENNQTQAALDLVNSLSVKNEEVLQNWLLNLKARNALNQIIIRLTQYLLNYTSIE